jgi:hypothetical protein
LKIINEDQKQKVSIKTMKVKGRKSKLTTELIEKISTEIENGSYQKVAARKCGVGESTFYAWMEKAEGGVGGQFQELMEAVQNASAVAESRAIQTILADNSWQSKAWYLERRFPERWRRKDRLDSHHTREPKVVFHTIKQMSEQEWNEMTGTETKELNSVKEIN